MSDSVDLNTALVFVNVIYFKGIWKTAFKEEYTREEPFNVTEVGGHGHTSGQGSCWLTQAGVWVLQTSVTGWVIFLSPPLSVSGPKANLCSQDLCLTRLSGHTSKQERKIEIQLFPEAAWLKIESCPFKGPVHLSDLRKRLLPHHIISHFCFCSKRADQCK